MSQKLFDKYGHVTNKVNGKSWLGKPMAYALDKAIETETNETKTWQEEATMLMLEQNPVKAKKLLYAITFILIALLVWAALAKVDEVTRGEGRVIPSRQVQVIQSLDGGIVSEILVKGGEDVKIGQPLIKVDETRAISSLKENQGQFLALQAREARLKALSQGLPFSPPPEVQKNAPEVFMQELSLFNASRDQLNSLVNIARDQKSQREKELMEVQFRREVAVKNYDSANKELAANRPLLTSGAVSEIDILRLEREATKAKGEIDQTTAQLSRINVSINEATRKIAEAEQSFLSRIRTELNETSAKINSLTQTSVALSDKVKQSTLKSPVNGKISKLFYNTVGGVIQPGKEVMEIVPTDESLIIETKVETKDIAFLSPNQPAVVKLTAYDYTIYGTLDAIVQDIAADSTVDDKGNAYYIVKVRTLKNSLGEHLPIIPGMVAQVDILTGKKTILSYLLKPVLKAKSYALTER